MKGEGIRISRRAVLRSGAAAGVVIGFPSVLRAQTKELVIACPTTYGRPFQENFFKLFEAKQGVKVLVEGGPSAKHLEKLRANRSAPVTSIAFMDDPVMIEAERDGLLEPLTTGNIPNLSKVPAGAIHKGGAFVNYMLPPGTIAYNTKRVPGGISSWAQLWEPSFKGSLLLQPFPDVTQSVFPLIVASSIASGLSFEAALHNPDAIDAGFKKLVALKPNVLVVSSNTSQCWTLLQQGEASAFIASPAQSVPAFKRAGGPLEVAHPREGSFTMPNSVCLIKGGPNADLARQLVNEFFGDEYQGKLASVFEVSPISRTAPLPQGFTPVPNLHSPDWEYIVNNTRAWADRWAREMAV